MPDEQHESSERLTPVPPAAPAPAPAADLSPRWDAEKIGSWIVQGLIAVVAFFLVHQFNSIQDDLKELRKDVEAVRLVQAAQQERGTDIARVEADIKALRSDLRALERRLLWGSAPSTPVSRHGIPAPLAPGATPR